MNGYNYRAVFSNDSGTATTTAATLMVTIVKAVSTVSLSASPNPVALGAPVTLTATVNSATPVAAGPTRSAKALLAAATVTVTFSEGARTLSTFTLTGASATYTTPFAVPGSHTINAAYSGEANTLQSSSATILVVAAAPAEIVTAPALSTWMLGLLGALIAQVAGRALGSRRD